MRWSSRNVPAEAAAEREKVKGQVVRRTEILVERKVCSIEVHGVAGLEQCTHCPVCGQKLLEQGKSSEQ